MVLRLIILLLLSAIVSPPIWATEPKLALKDSTSEDSYFLLGLDLEFLVPDNLDGLSLPQTLTGAHFGTTFGQDNLLFSAFYSSTPETSSLFLTEVDYRFNISTPFIPLFVLAGLHYLHFRINLTDKDFVGPIIGLGVDLPMAQQFKMGLQMKVYSQKKTMLSFGGGFSFLI